MSPGVHRYPSSASRARVVALVTGMVCLVPATIGVIAAVAGLLPFSPASFVGAPNDGPSAAHWLGCDALG
ncbi:MAG TPA: hypothetical protein VIU40_15340, partial [Geobacteraceae bacterium]